MRRVASGAVAIALAAVTALTGYAVADAKHADASSALGPGLVTVTVDIHYSHFSLSTLDVRTGTTVRFLIRNEDPINHEFIVGDARVHALHEHGTHPAHPPVPGEVSVPGGQLGETFYRFDQPGKVLFACHLPGHFAYGMRGWISVTPA
jgi:uncharacterized cupredoxin-like copper-binding protein